MTKLAKENVLHEHRDGRPHITVDSSGTYRYYCLSGPRDGEVMRPIAAGMIRLLPRAPASTPSSSSSSRPAKVASDAFRAGWDAIDWSRKDAGKPS